MSPPIDARTPRVRWIRSDAIIVVKVLHKALMLIEVLSETGISEGEGVSNLARQLNLDKATVFRLLSTLRQNGYVEKDESTDRYRLTLKMWTLGSRIANNRPLTLVARPVLRELWNNIGETVYIAVLVGNEAVIIDKIEGRSAVHSLPKVGARLPLHGGSAGKAILAFQDEAFIDEICANLRPATANTITSKRALMTELAGIRKTGYAINVNELRADVSAVGAPIRSADGRVSAALSISGPTVDMPVRRLRQLSKVVREAAARIAGQVGSI